MSDEEIKKLGYEIYPYMPELRQGYNPFEYDYYVDLNAGKRKGFYRGYKYAMDHLPTVDKMISSARLDGVQEFLLLHNRPVADE